MKNEKHFYHITMKFISILFAIFAVTFLDGQDFSKIDFHISTLNRKACPARNIGKYCLSIFNKKTGYKYIFKGVKEAVQIKFIYGINVTIIFAASKTKKDKEKQYFLGEYYEPYKKGPHKNHAKKRCIIEYHDLTTVS